MTGFVIGLAVGASAMYWLVRSGYVKIHRP